MTRPPKTQPFSFHRNNMCGACHLPKVFTGLIDTQILTNLIQLLIKLIDNSIQLMFKNMILVKRKKSIFSETGITL